ncbi:hypothetical protein DYB37_005877 [Aphanomyces astaci]|nr:hypothetical protein DYB35_003177 [Aphanomyces astaci]RHZ27160.1 hypothetical protein DYB37_005877 [Aphanomyces astaci]
MKDSLLAFSGTQNNQGELHMTQDDKRPNTAGGATRKPPGSQFSPAGGPRPGSAADAVSPVGEDRASLLAAPPPSTSGHLKIADIVNRNRRKTSSSADLIKDFEGAIRKVVDGKRSECDKLKYTVEKKRDELDKLKLALQDLRADCAALGMNEFPDPSDRLESISSVSRRPLYAKKTNIRALEEQLRLKGVDTIAVMRKTLTYEHIKKRHEVDILLGFYHALDTVFFQGEKAWLIQSKADLTIELREKQQRLQEYHRVELSASEALNQVQTRLVQLKADIAAEIRLYETELHLRQRWVKEKAKFEAFYAKQINQSEWYRHKDAFGRLGVPGGVVNPTQIIAMCSTHASLKQELQLRQAEQEQILAATKTRIDEVKAELQQSQLGSVRSSDRDLHDAQAELAVAEKLLHKAREEYEYMQQVLEPVKAGIQQIVAQVIGKKVDTDNIHAIENALHMVEKELLIIVPDLTAPSNDEVAAI